MTETTDILQRLSQPLDRRRVKLRPAPGEGAVPYLEGFDVIQTANEIFGFRWSFDLLSEPRVMIWEQTLTTWDRQKRMRTPVVDPQTGQPCTQRAGIVYLTGKVTIELDGKPYSHADVGRLSFTGDAPEALDTALSGAATDCLKRCFRQLGNQFGLGLYDKDVAKASSAVPIPEKENGASHKTPSNGKGSAAEKQEHAAASHPPDGMTLEQARLVLCPIGSSQNPQWAGMPLGQVLAQPKGERMLAYLVGEQFQDNDHPARAQARLAAQMLLSQLQPQGV